MPTARVLLLRQTGPMDVVAKACKSGHPLPCTAALAARSNVQVATTACIIPVWERPWSVTDPIDDREGIRFSISLIRSG